MRAVIPSVLVALVLSSVASANMAPPGIKVVRREIHVEFAEPYLGYTFFVVRFGGIARLPSTVGSVDLSELVGYSYVTARHAPPGRDGFELVAIPDDLVADIGGNGPDSTWFEKHRYHPRLRWGHFDPTIIDAPVDDPRERIIQTYRAKLTETDIVVERVSEVEVIRSPVPLLGWVVGAVAIVGGVSLVIWLVRRLRRKAVTRTTPPPGN